MSKYMYKLYGAILGDLVGQPHEFPAKGGPRENIVLHNPNSHFTDDTIMTIATAAHLLGRYKSFEDAYKTIGNMYVGDYYGKMFKEWLTTPPGTPLNSFGNGCLMRISPIMYLGDKESILPTIMDSVLCSHRNEISIKSCILLYEEYMGEGLPFYNEVTPFKKFTSRADDTILFCRNLNNAVSGTQNVIIKAIEQGGDTDTNASICGELSNFFNKDITDQDAEYVVNKIDDFMLDILHNFNLKF